MKTFATSSLACLKIPFTSAKTKIAVHIVHMMPIEYHYHVEHHVFWILGCEVGYCIERLSNAYYVRYAASSVIAIPFRIISH